MKSRPYEFLSRVYALSLYAYPRPFRARFGREMQQVFRDRCQAAEQSRAFAPFIFMSLKDWVTTSFRERFADGGKVRLSTLLRHPVACWMLAIFICLFTSTTMVRAYFVPSGSMEGNLRIGDHMLVDRIHSRAGDVHRGDIIAFRYPEDTGQTYVKRVIGLPGDRIRLAGKQVIRNGRRLVEPYVEHLDAATNAYRDNFPAEPGPEVSGGGLDMLTRHLTGGEVIVPPGACFVLGDNRDMSFDSRYWGFVPLENVVGKPWIVFWSFDAPTKDLVGWSLTHMADVAEHFFTKTRWSRTLLVLRSQPAQEVEP